MDQLLSDLDGLLAPEAVADESTLAWDVTAELGGGYESNPLLSANRRFAGSAYQRVAFDSLVNWSPTVGALTGFAFYERRQFLAESFDPEQVALASLSWEQPFGNYRWGARAGYLFAEQAYDASISTSASTPVTSGLLRQQVPSFALTLQRPIGSWSVEWEIPFERSIFDRSTDDYWRTGLRMSLERRWGLWNRLDFFIEARRSQYLSGLERDPRGFPSSEKRVLALRQLRLGGEFRWTSNLRRKWELRGESWFEIEHDGEGDYYDRRRVYARFETHWRPGKWHLEWGASAYYLDYLARRINPVDEPTQWQFRYGVDFQVDRPIVGGWDLVLRTFATTLESNRSSLAYRNQGAEIYLSKSF